MQDFVMLEYPGLLLIWGLGFGAGVLDRRRQTGRGGMTWLASTLVVTATALVILHGASLWEAAGWLTAFLLSIMGVKE